MFTEEFFTNLPRDFNPEEHWLSTFLTMSYLIILKQHDAFIWYIVHFN